MKMNQTEYSVQAVARRFMYECTQNDGSSIAIFGFLSDTQRAKQIMMDAIERNHPISYVFEIYIRHIEYNDYIVTQYFVFLLSLFIVISSYFSMVMTNFNLLLLIKWIIVCNWIIAMNRPKKISPFEYKVANYMAHNYIYN